MEEAIRQIGERLKGLRDIMDIPAEEIAGLCGLTVEEYNEMETGERELSVSNLQKISKRYGIELDVLLFGEEPHMSAYYITRKGQGMSVERRSAYKYQSLASGFRGRTADPFLVKVEPIPAGVTPKKNSHQGQEFNIVSKGSMEVTIGKKVLVLNEGDSIYFDATQPHCMRALNNETVEFLAIILG